MVNQEVVKKGKRTRNNEAFGLLETTPKGESIIILKEDWKMKTIPGRHLIRRRIHREFLMETLKNGTGWKLTSL